MKQANNSHQLPKPTRNTLKIANRLITVASSESEHDLICHVPKVKAATSAHSVADLIFPSNLKRFDEIKRKFILRTVKNTMSVTFSVY